MVTILLEIFSCCSAIMTSLWLYTWDVGTYFEMYGKRSPLAILWYQLGVSLGFTFTGGDNHSLFRRVTKKAWKNDNSNVHSKFQHYTIIFFSSNGDFRYPQVATIPRARNLWRLTLSPLKGVIPIVLIKMTAKRYTLDYRGIRSLSGGDTENARDESNSGRIKFVTTEATFSHIIAYKIFSWLWYLSDGNCIK